MKRLLVLMPLAAILGCQREPPPARTTVTSAELGSPPNDDAIVRVATIRCERELACDKIGSDRAYEDQSTCLERMGKLMSSEIGKAQCPLGVDAVRVGACVAAIQKTPCGGALEETPNLAECTGSTICLMQ